MKYKEFLFVLFMGLFMGACSDNDDDNGKNNADRTETQAWIEDTMRDKYYWNNEIPKASNLNYNLAPEAFFASLLSTKDGKYRTGSDGNKYHSPYSRIENVSSEATRGFIQSDYTYGFEFNPVWFGNEWRAIVLYVLPNSPAYGKLDRGDWIVKVDGASMTTDASVMSLYGDGAKTFTLARFDATDSKFYISGDVDIESARVVEDNPVFYSSVLTRGNKKIGYLVYNHFTDGKDDDGDTSYNSELLALSTGKFSGVDEFVLDLRYNNGGTLSSATLLSAILGPSDILNKNIGYMKYNNGSKGTVTTSASLLTGGKNLNLKTLYILTSSMSASASEAVINFLNPFMDVVLIGRKTEGKNVGSTTFKSDDKQWEMHPIIGQIYNSVDFSDYANGFNPDYEEGDVLDYHSDNTVSPVGDIYSLGNTNERLLRIALGLIDGTYTRSDAPSAGATLLYYKEGTFNSLDRKATNGVIIDGM